MVIHYPRARSKVVVAAALAGLILAAPGAPAQETTNSTVGSPLLRDFSLPGTRTTPPADQPPQPAPTDPRTQTAPVPQPSVPDAEPAPDSVQRRNVSPASPGAARTAPEPQVAIPSDAQQEDVPVDALPQGLPPLADSAEILPAPSVVPAETPEQSVSGLALWGSLGAILALLAGLFLYRRRREPLAEHAGLPAPSADVTPPPPILRQPAVPATDPLLKVDLRPWLELEFKPEKMIATATEVTVHFALVVKNAGKSPARNVRIQARMFNPSPTQKQEIGLFLAAAAEAGGESFNIPPQLAARFNTSVVMPKSNVREIQVQGRSLFIPTVAINVLYEWGDGRKGQTSNSYVIGTETKTESDKMGPFRLDLGPRIYRQVGGRPIDLARAL